MLGEETVDGGMEIGDGAEDAVLQPSPGQLGEEALDGVGSGAGDRGEVEGPAGMAGEPGAHLLVLVGGVVVQDGVDHLADRDSGFDRVQEADELLVPVSPHVAADHGAVEDVEGGKQRGGAMALLVVGQQRRRGPASAAVPAGRDQAPGSSPGQALDLASSSTGQHHGMGRRVDIEADHIT